MVQAIKRDEVYIEPEGIYVETQQPERRSRKPPLLLVHGALTGSWLWSSFGAFFAERGWEAHAMNLRGHYTSDIADLGSVSDARLRDRHRRGHPPAGPAAGRDRLGDRRAGGHAVRRAATASWAWSCWRRRRRPARCHGAQRPRAEGRAAASTTRRWWGWITDWDKLHEVMPDMTDDALEKMQEMLDGARESGSARRERMRGVAVDTARIEVPSLVIAAGRDDVIHPTEARRTADLLGAAYEYFPSASHFGLVMGEESGRRSPARCSAGWRSGGTP